MVKNNLKNLLEAKNLKIIDLAQRTGMGYKFLLNIYHNKAKKIDFDTLDKICRGLGCTPQEFFYYISE